MDKKSRTHDQMVQAARSDKNINEGSQVSGTSQEGEQKLTGVARGSLEELLGDYRDYLRQRGLRKWEANDRKALIVNKLGERNGESYESYRSFIENRPAEVMANILICLIHLANYLLDQLLRQLEQKFLQAGGLHERMPAPASPPAPAKTTPSTKNHNPRDAPLLSPQFFLSYQPRYIRTTRKVGRGC